MELFVSRALVAAAFALSTVATPTLLVATPAAAATCGENVPAEWKRPGGYCDQLEGKDSLTEPVEGDPCSIGFLYELLLDIPVGEKILVATC